MKNLTDISVAIITKNEENNLPACLESVLFSNDIVVVDSGSTDRTIEIAEKSGCRIFKEEWKGYALQKNSAVQKCINNWVLVIDADERVPTETVNALKTLVAGNPTAGAYRFPRKNFFHNKWLKHGGQWPDRQTKLVRRDNGKFTSIIHERWMTEGTIENIELPIEHYCFSGYSDLLTTLNEYSTITAYDLFSSGKKTNIFTPACHGIAMFSKIYFLKKVESNID